MNYFDIETIPLKRDEVERMMPEEILCPIMPEELRHPIMPTFEHKGLRDEAKIKEWRQNKESEWKTKLEHDKQKWNIGVMDKRNQFFERAALKPETGRVAMINFGESGHDKKVMCINLAATGSFLTSRKPENVTFYEFKDEKSLLEHWIVGMDGCRTLLTAGFCIKHFDLPFLRRRCWYNGVRFPRWLTGGRLSGYMWDDMFVDLQEVFASGDRTERPSQDFVCRAFGMNVKPDDGAMFWKLLKENKPAALGYATHDITTIVELGGRMGVDRHYEA